MINDITAFESPMCFGENRVDTGGNILQPGTRERMGVEMHLEDCI